MAICPKSSNFEYCLLTEIRVSPLHDENNTTAALLHNDGIILLPSDQMSLGRQLLSQFSRFWKETKARPDDYASSFSVPALARIFVPLMRRASYFLFGAMYLPLMPFNSKFNQYPLPVDIGRDTSKWYGRHKTNMVVLKHSLNPSNIDDNIIFMFLLLNYPKS